jgi:hypothetical protein
VTHAWASLAIHPTERHTGKPTQSPAEWSRDSRRAQGLSQTVEDAVALANVQTIMRAALANRLNSATLGTSWLRDSGLR